MAEAKVNNSLAWYLGWALIIVGAVFAGAQAMKDDGLKVEWRRVAMDGHRTGAQPVTSDNIPQALGTFTDEGYMCPSGACYMDDSPVAQEAAELLEVQPQLAHLKKVIGHSAGMYMNLRNQPDLPLGNLVADIFRAYGSRYFKVPMDFAITNYGGMALCFLLKTTFAMRSCGALRSRRSWSNWLVLRRFRRFPAVRCAPREGSWSRP